MRDGRTWMTRSPACEWKVTIVWDEDTSFHPNKRDLRLLILKVP